jgi:hypothetical protein
MVAEVLVISGAMRIPKDVRRASASQPAQEKSLCKPSYRTFAMRCAS